MTEPLHDLSHAFDPRPVGQRGAREHDHGKVELARGIDLGACAAAAGIARDDPFDAARAHHLELAVTRERPARDEDISGEWQRSIGRIDEPQRIGVLRSGAERGDMLAADRKEHAGRILGQCGYRRCDIRDLDPVIALSPIPRCALKRNQRRAGGDAGRHRVAAHLGREGMGRVDHMRDALRADVVGKAISSAEAADARRQRLIGRSPGAASVGIDRIYTRARDRRGEQIGVRRSAQNEGARYG